MKTKIFFLSIVMLIFSSSYLFCELEPVQPSGSGTAEDPFLISTIENLYWLTQNSEHWDKHYEQTADIDASDSENWAYGEGFTPIGEYSNPFTGTYNGNSYNISNIYLHQSGDYNGLFGYMDGAEIKNLDIVNLDYDFVGYSIVGGIVGRLTNSIVKNCNVTGTINCHTRLGGIAGEAINNSIIENCSANGSFYVYNSSIGGIAGKISSNTTINNCSFHGKVSTGAGNGGGIVAEAKNNSLISNCYFTGRTYCYSTSGGIAAYTSSNGTTIMNCYSTGIVSSILNHSGGIVGSSDGTTVSNCFSKSKIKNNDFSAGGISGWTTNTEITNCYFAGYFEGNAFGKGVIIGIRTNSSANNCYSNTNFYDLDLFTNGAIGKTTAEMTLYGNNGADPTAVYANWDFYDAETNPDGVWAVDETHGGYPYLKKLADLFGTNTLTVNADGNGSAYGSGKYNIGASAAVYAEPDEDYFFIKWYSDSDTALFDEQAYLHPLEGDEVLYAKFDDTNVSIDDNPIYTYSLSQNKPNPFNPSTVIKYSIPEDSFVKVEVYNILGRKIKTLVSGSKEKGEYSVVWNGTDSNGEKVSSGVYFYRIINRGEVINKKMLLMK